MGKYLIFFCTDLKLSYQVIIIGLLSKMYSCVKEPGRSDKKSVVKNKIKHDNYRVTPFIRKLVFYMNLKQSEVKDV